MNDLINKASRVNFQSSEAVRGAAVALDRALQKFGALTAAEKQATLLELARDPEFVKVLHTLQSELASGVSAPRSNVFGMTQVADLLSALGAPEELNGNQDAKYWSARRDQVQAMAHALARLVTALSKAVPEEGGTNGMSAEAVKFALDGLARILSGAHGDEFSKGSAGDYFNDTGFLQRMLHDFANSVRGHSSRSAPIPVKTVLNTLADLLLTVKSVEVGGIVQQSQWTVAMVKTVNTVAQAVRAAAKTLEPQQAKVFEDMAAAFEQLTGDKTGPGQLDQWINRSRALARDVSVQATALRAAADLLP